MTSIIGNDLAQAGFLAAMASGSLHHAWLIAGPEGTGKARFAEAAALRMLAEGARPGSLPPGLHVPDGNATRALFLAGSHPDYRRMARLPKESDKTGTDLARSITIAQVRALQPLFATTPSMSSRRVVVIDAIDDLERGGSNALLKNLEEPPQGTIFLLVSHAPGRLLPTIRSRCRVLRFEPLADTEVRAVLAREAPETSAEELDALVRAGAGSPGRAMRYTGLDLAKLDVALAAIARDGDRDNARRITLSRALAGKPAQARYEAFLDRAPTIIAEAAALRHGPALRTALDAYDAARALGSTARGLSLDPAGTVFEMSGIVARLAA